MTNKLYGYGFVEFDDGNCDALKCPRCGEGNLHHRGVKVFDRKEDAETTTLTTVKEGLVASHLVPSDGQNPSDRRDGVAVSFECEHCPAVLELTIAQHKGITQLGWRVDLRATWSAEAKARQRPGDIFKNYVGAITTEDPAA